MAGRPLALSQVIDTAEKLYDQFKHESRRQAGRNRRLNRSMYRTVNYKVREYRAREEARVNEVEALSGIDLDGDGDIGVAPRKGFKQRIEKNDQ